jgi:hypothetical protein
VPRLGRVVRPRDDLHPVLTEHAAGTVQRDYPQPVTPVRRRKPLSTPTQAGQTRRPVQATRRALTTSPSRPRRGRAGRALGPPAAHALQARPDTAASSRPATNAAGTVNAGRPPTPHAARRRRPAGSPRPPPQEQRGTHQAPAAHSHAPAAAPGRPVTSAGGTRTRPPAAHARRAGLAAGPAARTARPAPNPAPPAPGTEPAGAAPGRPATDRRNAYAQHPPDGAALTAPPPDRGSGGYGSNSTLSSWMSLIGVIGCSSAYAPPAARAATRSSVG